ncbi:MAG: TonB-dependent receptor [Bacteroidales bacterium]|nr:TonB-dependent receptor [Bacteroidales bacterium]
MKNYFIFLLVIIQTAVNPVLAERLEQRPVTDANVFGHVIDAETGEHIPFINLLIEGTRIGTITDATGHYILTNLPVGDHVLIVQGMGYETARVAFTAVARQTIEVDVKVNSTHINLSEIIITASPTASGFRYQPDKSFIGEDLQRRSEASFGEMLNGEPGVAMRSMGSAPARPVIRGLDGDRILVLQNGERMGDISETSADHSISLDPLAASRVEVVRGPASLLYGSSALGGVINLMTTDIPDDADMGTSGVFSLQGATVNSMGAGFGRITQGMDNWAASARFSYRQAGDTQTPGGIIPDTGMNNYDGSVGFGLKKGQNAGGLSLSLTGQNYGLPGHSNHPSERVEIAMQRQSLQGRWNYQRSGFFDRGQLRFNASRMLQDELEIEEAEGMEEENIELSFEKYTLSSTATLQHKPYSIFARGAFGMNLYAHSLDVSGDEAFTPGERRMALGVFTFQEIPLSNIFRLQAGIRFDLQHTGALPNDIFPQANESRNAFNYSGSIGLNHRPLPGWEVGGQFARSHRNPNIQELFAHGVHLGAGVFEIGDPTLKDEIGNGGDFFIRYGSEKMEFELATFVNHFYNFIIFVPTGEEDEDSGFAIFRYEGDEARLMGGEISLGWMPTESLTLGLGLDYVYGRRIGNGKEDLPFIPPLRFRADIEYDFGWGWLGAKMQATATQNRVAPEEDITQGYTLLGASAGYRLNKAGRHVIILRADNLLNTSYRDHLSRMEDRNYLMPGRNISLAYRWFF